MLTLENIKVVTEHPIDLAFLPSQGIVSVQRWTLRNHAEAEMLFSALVLLDDPRLLAAKIKSGKEVVAAWRQDPGKSTSEPPRFPPPARCEIGTVTVTVGEEEKPRG